MLDSGRPGPDAQEAVVAVAPHGCRHLRALRAWPAESGTQCSRAAGMRDAATLHAPAIQFELRPRLSAGVARAFLAFIDAIPRDPTLPPIDLSEIARDNRMRWFVVWLRLAQRRWQEETAGLDSCGMFLLCS